MLQIRLSVANTQKQEDNIFAMSVKVEKHLFLSSAIPFSESFAAATPACMPPPQNNA